MIKLGSLGLALALAAPARAGESRPVAAVVTAVQGKPTIRLEGKGSPRRLKRTMMVYEGDELKTGQGELISLAMTGGAEFKINENSTFVVQSGGSGTQPASLRTILGDAWTRMLHSFAGVDVHTPLAVAAVRGTEGDIESGQQQLTVKVYEGHIDLMSAQGKTLAQLRAGQMSSLGASGAPQTRAMSASDRASWQEGLRAKNLQGALNKLNQAAQAQFLQIQTKNGKVINIPLKRKHP